jgi:aryl-alcohol dehydrogenase-like predicted oxidoreductase
MLAPVITQGAGDLSPSSLPDYAARASQRIISKERRETMEFRTLGHSELRVSVIAHGTWAIGGPWAHGWGEVDDQESIASIRRSLDLGINLIDTANVYGLGHAEKIVAKAVGGRRDQVVIATKVGAKVDADGNISWDSTPEHLYEEVENSLRRLETDYIDVYQIHWPDAETPLADTMGAFNRLIEQGKIRYAGVCNFTKAQLEEAVRYAPIVSNQIRYNMLERDNEADVLPFCIQNGIGVMAYGPLAHGLLGGEFQHGDKLQADDWRSRYTLFDPPVFEKIMGIVDKLAPIAESHRRTLAHLAINWVLSRPGISTALIGMRQAGHVDENVRSTGWHLSPEDLEQIDRAIMEADLGLRILPPDEYLEQTKQDN